MGVYPPQKVSTGTRRTSKSPWKKDLLAKRFILGLILLVSLYTFIILFGELFFLFPLSKSEWCKSYDPKYDYLEYGFELKEGDVQRLTGASGDSDFISEMTNSTEKEYENPDYITDPCRYERIFQLCWLTREECDLSRRMLAAVFLGGAIGYERRASDRPAGIRTMGLVSLGSALFTINSQLAFKSSTMGWDSSRVTAAIPSGVGFLGAGLIWKGTVGIGDEEVHQVHGLTTAASLWLSAAVGVGCGGALYFATLYSTILVLMVLRFGPKLYLLEDSDSVEDEEDSEDDDYSITEDELSDTHVKHSSPNQPLIRYNELKSNKYNGNASTNTDRTYPTDSSSTETPSSAKGTIPKNRQTYDTFGIRQSESENLISSDESNGRAKDNPPRVAFNLPDENLKDVDESQTALKDAPASEKKIKKHHPSNANRPSFLT